MVNATIIGYEGVKTGNFSLQIHFAQEVTDFDDSDITIAATDENPGDGITGVSLSISSSSDPAVFNIAVTVPDSQEGRFTIEVTGEVTIQTGSQSESVSVIMTVRTISYDTLSDITITFLEDNIQRDVGLIEIPFTLNQDVRSISASDFAINKVDSANNIIEEDLFDIGVYIYEEESNYILAIATPEDMSGRLSIHFSGDVLKMSGIEEFISEADPIYVDYNNDVPEGTFRSESSISSRIFDIYLDFNVLITGLAWSSFSHSGIELPEPAIYYDNSSTRLTRGHPPTNADLPNSIPDDVSGLAVTFGDWTKTSNDGTHPESRFFLLRYTISQEILDSISGSYNLSLLPNTVRGPQ